MTGLLILIGSVAILVAIGLVLDNIYQPTQHEEFDQ